MTKDEKIRAATIKIFESILYHMNGYSMEDIKQKELAKDCEGDDLWDEIYESVKLASK
jgi:hypothetical protein